MINIRTLKLKKIYNLKEYLQEKARRDKEYNEYVKEAIRKGEEDIAEGRVYTEEEFLKELAKDIEEFEMMLGE